MQRKGGLFLHLPLAKKANASICVDYGHLKGRKTDGLVLRR